MSLLACRIFFLTFIGCSLVTATVNVKTYGAAGNGSANDTAAVASAIAAACSTRDSVYFPAGVYLIDPLGYVNGCNTTLYGDGSTASILRFRSALTGSFQSLVTFNNGSSLTIHDLAFDGRHAELAGFAIVGYSTVALTNVASYNFGTPGYSEGYRNSFDGFYIINTSTVNVQSSSFTGNERMGLELQADANATVNNSTMSGNGGMGGVSEQNFAGTLAGPGTQYWTNNMFDSNGSGCIDVETDPSLPPAHGIITGNVCSNSGKDNWDSGWGLVLGLNAYGTISNNKITNYSVNANANTVASGYDSAIVFGTAGGPITISNNTVTGARGNAIRGANSPYTVQITGNSFSGNGSGMDLYSDPGVQVGCNSVTNSLRYGIAVSESTGYKISNNTISGNNPNLSINGSVVAPDGDASGCGNSALNSFPANQWLNIVSAVSGQCLDVASFPETNWAQNNGTPVKQWPCWNGPNQKWMFVPVSGGYKIISQNSSQALEVASPGGDISRTARQDGAVLQQWPYWGGANQVWQPAQNADGTWSFASLNSSGTQCLDVPWWSGTNWAQNPGTQMQQWNCWSGPSQKWKLQAAQ